MSKWLADGSMIYLKDKESGVSIFELNVMTGYASVKLADRMKFANDLAEILNIVDSTLQKNQDE